jgi:hypothetical protein
MKHQSMQQVRHTFMTWGILPWAASAALPSNILRLMSAAVIRLLAPPSPLGCPVAVPEAELPGRRSPSTSLWCGYALTFTQSLPAFDSSLDWNALGVVEMLPSCGAAQPKSCRAERPAVVALASCELVLLLEQWCAELATVVLDTKSTCIHEFLFSRPPLCKHNAPSTLGALLVKAWWVQRYAQARVLTQVSADFLVSEG